MECGAKKKQMFRDYRQLRTKIDSVLEHLW
jgi:hypothetical protein